MKICKNCNKFWDFCECELYNEKSYKIIKKKDKNKTEEKPIPQKELEKTIKKLWEKLLNENKK